jgi:hypothetical protein
LTAQFAASKKTAIGSAIKVAKGVVTGETANVNKLRRISEEEAEALKSRLNACYFSFINNKA